MLNQSSNTGNINGDGEILVNNTEFINNFAADYSGAQTNLNIISGVVSKTIEIHNIYISSSTNTGAVTLTEETSGTVIHKQYLNAQGNTTSGTLHKDLTAGKGLLLTCPANTFISISYHLD